MTISLKCYADYLSIGLRLGLCSVDEMIAWADRLIEERDSPSDWMIDLSTSSAKHLLDIIRLLELVPGTEDLEIAFRLLIAKLGIVYPTLVPEQNNLPQPKHCILFRKLYRILYPFDGELIALSDEVISAILLVGEDFNDLEYGYRDWSMVNQDYEKLLALGSEYKRFVVDL